MQTISLMHGLYRLTVTFYGDTAALSEGNWALNATAVLDGLIGALVQVRGTFRGLSAHDHILSQL